MSDDSTAELPVPDDLKLAAVAAACTVGLTLALEYGLSRDVSFLVRLVPLVPYFVYLFSRPVRSGKLDSVRNWSVLTVSVTLGVLVYAAV
ncbi:hypothetical protein [Halogeometricum limi]|uniref:DUF8049 domain-containing protein n=1 Tax=Halogeometricum limi TaxID=555875 RepID=A0A1I6IQG1_9EURY|nr:hypothetical protein [Halogeometricum limi]SFR68974.1 hypothetical protein SAMN04488124_3509 [Halogeometricum limi]